MVFQNKQCNNEINDINEFNNINEELEKLNSEALDAFNIALKYHNEINNDDFKTYSKLILTKMTQDINELFINKIENYIININDKNRFSRCTKPLKYKIIRISINK